MVLDMIAKAGVLNHTQFNGKFGCPRCLVVGETAETKKVWVYRYSSQASKRTAFSRRNTIWVVELLGGPIMGIKGLLIFLNKNFCFIGNLFNPCWYLGMSCLEEFVKIPDYVPFDYMHQVLLGVVRTLLHNICKGIIPPRFRMAISERLVMFRLPYQEFSRQLRGLDKLKLWKASEFKSFLFYGFITFLDYLHPNLLAHFFCLSTAIRILLEENDNGEKCQLAAVLLDTFRRCTPCFYGESAETFNMHSLSHLVDDVSFKVLFGFFILAYKCLIYLIVQLLSFALMFLNYIQTRECRVPIEESAYLVMLSIVLYFSAIILSQTNFFIGYQVWIACCLLVLPLWVSPSQLVEEVITIHIAVAAHRSCLEAISARFLSSSSC